MTKFSKCEAQGAQKKGSVWYWKDVLFTVSEMFVIEQALAQAESFSLRKKTLEKKPNAVDIGMLEHNAYHDGYREGKNDGAKAERERIWALLAKLRNYRFVYNDEMKLAVDMIKDEITS